MELIFSREGRKSQRLCIPGCIESSSGLLLLTYIFKLKFDRRELLLQICVFVRQLFIFIETLLKFPIDGLKLTFKQVSVLVSVQNIFTGFFLQLFKLLIDGRDSEGHFVK